MSMCQCVNVVCTQSVVDVQRSEFSGQSSVISHQFIFCQWSVNGQSMVAVGDSSSTAPVGDERAVNTTHIHITRALTECWLGAVILLCEFPPSQLSPSLSVTHTQMAALSSLSPHCIRRPRAHRVTVTAAQLTASTHSVVHPPSRAVVVKFVLSRTALERLKTLNGSIASPSTNEADNLQPATDDCLSSVLPWLAFVGSCKTSARPSYIDCQR